MESTCINNDISLESLWKELVFAKWRPVSYSSYFVNQLQSSIIFLLCPETSPSSLSSFGASRSVVKFPTNDLLLNHSNCFECPFCLLPPNSLATPILVDGSSLSQTNIVKYLRHTFSSYLTWSSHFESVFMRGHKICYVLKRLRSAVAPREKRLLITDSLLIPLITYCSIVIFPGLLEQDFIHLRRLVSPVSKFTFIPSSTLATRIVERHLLLLTLRSLRPSWCAFRCAHVRTVTHRKSMILSLLRFLLTLLR